jgi:hypothetical protein
MTVMLNAKPNVRKALFDCDYKLDCWPDCSQIVARLFCGAQPPMRDSV